MKFLDNKTKELESYLPELTRKPDFDEFWERNRKKSNQIPLNVRLEPLWNPFDNVESYDVWYTSSDEATTCHGIFIKPKNAVGKIPVVILFHGFTWYCGQVADHLQYVNMGMAVLSMDHRGQNGASPDCHGYKTGGFGVMSHGVEDPEDYYFKWSILDGFRAIDYVLSRDDIDANKLFVHGGSQGGAMSFSVACLDERVKYCFCDVPSNTNIERRIENEHGSFGQVADYLRRHPDKIETVYNTLSYFDTMNMADKCKADVYASVGLRDNTCPAICYYAAYNRLTCKKHIEIYPYAGHEGGGYNYNNKKLKFMYDIING
ncbi:MAG: acetylxylan esterase [Clostridia bacterium]|nr:acetylxylan esterase [Clostridia bacterium]